MVYHEKKCCGSINISVFSRGRRVRVCALSCAPLWCVQRPGSSTQVAE